MKKIFIFVSLFFSFLFFDNVYAQNPDVSLNTNILSQFYQPDGGTNSYITIPAKKTSTDNFINDLINNDYDVYAYATNTCVVVMYVEKSLNFDLEFYVAKGKLSNNSNLVPITIGFNLNHESNISYFHKQQMCGNNNSFTTPSTSNVAWSSGFGTYNLSSNSIPAPTNEFIIYYNSFDINFNSGNNQFNTYQFESIDSLQLCDDDGCDDNYLLLNDRIINAPFTFVNSPTLSSTNRVIKYDDDFYGFFNNYLVINNIFDNGNSVLGSAVNCVENPNDLSSLPNSRLFSNGYCSFDKVDKSDDINDIQFLDSYFAFSNIIGDSSVNYLHHNNYYLYNFRLLKPFTPNLTHLILDTTSGSFNVPILNVYKYDGGSFVDYVVKFYLDFNSFPNLDSSSSLRAISLAFDDKVVNYYSSYNDFMGFSVFRSFKLQWFNTEPTNSQLSDFYFNEDLSKIDGVNRTNNFFTDTTFNTFGFSGIITAPFRFLYALESYNSCSSITLPFPHSNQSLTLVCVSDSIPSSINPLIIVLQTILSGIICYYIAVNTLATIKEILTPDKDSIEVVNL